MVQADQRRCLRQPISLDRRVAESAPEFFGLTVERGASRNKRPELPPKFPANRAKNPPPVQEMPAFRRAEPPLKLFGLPMLLRIEVFEIAFDLLPERLQNPRHGHQHRHSLAPDRVHDFRWIQLLLKNYNPAQQRRQKYPKKLPEDVAQWQQVKKPHRMNPSLILQVPLHLPLQRSDVSQHIAVRDHDSPGIGSRPRSKHDLQDVITSDRNIRPWGHGMSRDRLC